ncbi:MAG: hypothetical protein ACRETO_10390 [Gammaproteobacteria bacterium]
MRFDVAGPFKIVRYGKKKNITKDSLIQLKLDLENWEEGLSEACGCYIFAKRAGGGIIPWYVGQACRRAILNEALNSDNITKYNKVLDDNGTPVLFFIPIRTPNGKFRKRPKLGNLPALDFLERWLIANSIDRNENLINNKETRFLRKLHVVGVFNAKRGESTDASKQLDKTLWG